MISLNPPACSPSELAWHSNFLFWAMTTPGFPSPILVPSSFPLGISAFSNILLLVISSSVREGGEGSCSCSLLFIILSLIISSSDFSLSSFLRLLSFLSVFSLLVSSLTLSFSCLILISLTLMHSFFQLPSSSSSRTVFWMSSQAFNSSSSISSVSSFSLKRFQRFSLALAISILSSVLIFILWFSSFESLDIPYLFFFSLTTDNLSFFSSSRILSNSSILLCFQTQSFSFKNWVLVLNSFQLSSFCLASFFLSFSCFNISLASILLSSMYWSSSLYLLLSSSLQPGVQVGLRSSICVMLIRGLLMAVLGHFPPGDARSIDPGILLVPAVITASLLSSLLGSSLVVMMVVTSLLDPSWFPSSEVVLAVSVHGSSSSCSLLSSSSCSLLSSFLLS